MSIEITINKDNTTISTHHSPTIESYQTIDTHSVLKFKYVFLTINDQLYLYTGGAYEGSAASLIVIDPSANMLTVLASATSTSTDWCSAILLLSNVPTSFVLGFLRRSNKLEKKG